MNELYRDAYLEGKITAVDTEFVPITHEPVLLSYSWGRGIRRVVRAELVKDHFGDWLTDPQTKLAYQNYKEDVETMGALGLSEADLARSFYIDVMVAGVLRDETLVKHGLKAQMHHFLKWFRREYGQLFCYVPEGKKKPIVMNPRQVMDDLPSGALVGAVTKWVGSKGGHETGERFAEQWRQLMDDYAGDDAEGTQILAVDHRRYLKQTNYWDQYVAVDRPFTLTLMQCEQSGALVDQPVLRKILRKQDVRLLRSQHCFRAAAGNPKLNLRSGPQMKKLLFDEWGWPEHPSVQTDSGGVSMDKEVLGWWLREHKLEMAEVKLAFNNAATLKGTFLEGILTGVSEDGRLRSDLNQIGGKTSGRISSRKFDVLIEKHKTLKSGEVKTWIEKKKGGANLQNIPARKEKDPDGIRGAFRAPMVGEVTAWGDCATESHKLLVADYSGFHLVLVIHFVSKLTKESAMLDIMKKYKTPSAVHVYTTIQMFKHAAPHRCHPETCKDKKTGEWKKFHGENKTFSLQDFTMEDWKLVKPLFQDQYTYAKNSNFSMLFLGSPWTLAYNTGRDANDEEQLDECKRLYDEWYELYPEIKTYQNHYIDHAYEHGWVPTIGGRRGHVRKMLEGCDSSGKYIQDEEKRKKMVKHAERLATNVPAQGCLHPNTRVLTKEYGSVPIGSLAGDRFTVWDGERWVSAGAASSGDKRELVVRFWGGLEIRCSPDHRFWTNNHGGKRSGWTQGWKTPGEFKKQQFVVLSEATEWSAGRPGCRWDEFPSTGNGARDVSINALEGFDQGLFLGRIASDGSVVVRGDGGYVQLHVAEHEKMILPRLRELCTRIGRYNEHRLDRTAYAKQPMHRLDINSTSLAKQIGVVKAQIPDQIWASSSALRGYLCGMFDGDGTVNSDGPRLCFGSGHRHEAWAREVQLALFMFGIRSRLKLSGSTRIDVCVQKADSLQFAEVIGFLNPAKQEKLLAIAPRRSYRPVYGRVLRVAEVIDTGSEVTMFDVVNSESHRFAANGVITHNSEADIVKMALNNIRESKKLIELRVAPLFPVHDEVVCEGPERSSAEGLQEQIRLMKLPYASEMEVELAVEGGIGDNWISAKP
jgi:DNA polymerase I-like protein with 3'-5' exonuclease and polymerase domains